jgi:hypothetical protein
MNHCKQNTHAFRLREGIFKLTLLSLLRETIMLRTIKPALLAAGISILFLAAGADSEPTTFDIKRSAESEATVKTRIEQITAEAAAITASGPHWAGQYYHGDGLGVNVSLTIAPEAGFAFAWHGCLGVYDRNWGSVSNEPDGASRSPSPFPMSSRAFRGWPPALSPFGGANDSTSSPRTT